MSKLHIKLQQNYKSFPEGFEYVLEGQLIILSGINGSGKSQLIDIIYNKERVKRKKLIQVETSIDGISFDRKNVVYRSFKENISIPELTSANTKSSENSLNHVWNHYTNYILDPDDPNCINYSTSCEEARKILIKKLGKEKFDRKEITQEEVFNSIPNHFIWTQEDIFSNSVGEIFFNHAARIYEAHAQASKNKTSPFDESSIGLAPWSELNDLFKELRLEYRFKNNYWLNEWKINEQPKLFQVKSDGEIDENDYRQLADLSDGEKAIISLSFASLNGAKRENKKILLLDEFDATFNPTLTEIFFKILNKYFISKGIVVVIATHSTATISLAPSDASFYEVFRKGKSNPRIIEINSEDYSELQKVNESFYKRIADQEARIEDILKKGLTSKIKATGPIIITEGKTDWKYLLRALRIFHEKKEFLEISEEYFMKFGSSEDVSEKICGTDVAQEMSDSTLEMFLKNLMNVRTIDKTEPQNLRIGIYDSDNNRIKTITHNELKIFSFKIEPENISIEFLFKPEEITFEIKGKRLYVGDEFHERSKKLTKDGTVSIAGDNNNMNKAGKHVIVDTDVYDKECNNIALSKEEFAQAIFSGEIEISPESWEKFRPIFQKMKEVIELGDLATTKLHKVGQNP